MEEITTYINRAIRTEQRLFDLVAELGIEARKIEDRNAPEWKAFRDARAMRRGAHEVLKDMGVRLCGWDDELFGYWLDGIWYDYHEEGIDED